MSHTTTPALVAGSSSTTHDPAWSGLRTLHLVRAAASALWVALVLATSASLTSPDAPTVVAGVLLVTYPLWDAAATLLEQRANGVTSPLHTVNVALGVTASVAMLLAVLDTVGTALLVFGVWALVSGAVQLAVAVRRRRTVGAQWPMLVSGGLSVLAGAAFAAMSSSDSSDLSGLAGYSAFGAFWFLVSAVTLTRRHRGAGR